MRFGEYVKKQKNNCADANGFVKKWGYDNKKGDFVESLGSIGKGVSRKHKGDFVQVYSESQKKDCVEAHEFVEKGVYREHKGDPSEKNVSQLP